MKLLYFILLLLGLVLAGCYVQSEDTDLEDSYIALINAKVIYEETTSPNGAYVEEADKVINTVRVLQDESNRVVVVATSNNGFSKPCQYEIDCDKELSESDVSVKWLTIMGAEVGTMDDQLVVARITITVDKEVIDERKITFV